MRHGICDAARAHGAMREGLKVLRGSDAACTLAVESNQGAGHRCFDVRRFRRDIVWFHQAMHCRSTILDLGYKTQPYVTLSVTLKHCIPLSSP
jgi:hypothetical protein